MSTVSKFDYLYIKELAKRENMSVDMLLALSPKNDPFYAGTPTDKAQARWFRQIWDNAGYSTGVHLRRVHYWCVSKRVDMHDGQAYENTDKCWKYLTQASKMARYLGLIRIEDIVDNKNPAPNVGADYSLSHSSAFDFDIALPDVEDPEVSVYGYRAEVQPYHLEVWVEKSTMNDVLLPITRRYGANLVTFEGEVSITACYQFIRRLNEANDKPARIFYISDFDPAGNSMPVATARKIEFMLHKYGVESDVRLTPIALTAEQVERYDLPRVPIKETEKRAEKFEAAFGEGAVELDALEALYPGTLADIAERALSQYYNHEAAREFTTRASNMRAEIERRKQEVLEKYAPEFEAVKEALEQLRAIKVNPDDYLVERYEPHVDEDDERWMFASERNYLAQIVKYKIHKGIIQE